LKRVPGIGPKLARNLVEGARTLDVPGEEDRARRMGVDIITPLDEAYPPSLKEIHDPPLALYVKGTLEPKDRHAIALVGSRRCTHYGRMMADRLGYELGRVGYTVISGLARGIDTAAHQGALKSGGRTLAVLGGALDRLYPAENRDLARAITKQGAVMAEYPLGREPDRTTFPYRNRVVSGMCMGVVVVEAPPRSGSLITAEMAMEQGRSVFAVPGRVDTSQSRGCHQLIKNGARLVENVDDILEEFEALIPKEQAERARAVSRRPDVKLSAEEAQIVQALGGGPLDVDALSHRAALDMAALNARLLGLEMKRVVRMLPGRVVELAVALDDLG
jgi:DNA processing protein